MIDLKYRGWRFDPATRTLQRLDAGGWALHTDYPVYHPHLDACAFDRPECVPARIQARVARIMREAESRA